MKVKWRGNIEKKSIPRPFVSGWKEKEVYYYEMVNVPKGYEKYIGWYVLIYVDCIKVKEKILPVGRLDMYTSGALLLTNDSEFINKITHPSNEINKTYTVTVKGIVTNEDIEKLKNGVKIDDYISGKAQAKILKTDEEKQISRVQITIHEGKNREVRKMCEAIGKKVLALHRRKIENLDVKKLEIGSWRYLSKKEVQELTNY